MLNEIKILECNTLSLVTIVSYLVFSRKYSVTGDNVEFQKTSVPPPQKGNFPTPSPLEIAIKIINFFTLQAESPSILRRLLPLPNFSRKIERGSARRVKFP